jgi:signal transduction histidine kinase
LLFDSEGTTPGSEFNRTEIGNALSGQISTGIRYSVTLNTDLRYVAVPIRHGSEILGALRLSVPETDVQEDVRSLVMALLSVLVLVLLAAMFAAWGLARALSRPLGRLVEGAERVGEDSSARVGDVNGPPEIQAVAHALDETAAKLDGIIGRSSAVAADASHHLRTPLAAMRLRLEAIGDANHDAWIADQADAATTELDRLTRRIDQILTLATAEVQMSPVLVDVGESVHLRTMSWEALATDRGLDLHCKFESARVLARPGDVERILDELVGNSLSYARTSVRIEVLRDESDVHLIVSDDGPGIPIAERMAVFERFYRGSQSMPGGTGLGLSLVYEAVTAIGGTVIIEDNGLSMAAPQTYHPQTDDPAAGAKPAGTTVHVTWPSQPQN